MEIYLVRHGESLANVDKTICRDTPDHSIGLSDRGKKQATECGQWLADHLRSQHTNGKFVHPTLMLWRSPYERTRQTAALIAKQFRAKGMHFGEHEDIALCEQQFGLFDGYAIKDLADVFPHEHAHYEKNKRFEGRFWARMPLGESRFDVAMRVRQTFSKLRHDAEEHCVQRVVIVSHGAAIRCFTMQWLNLPVEWIEGVSNPRNCSVTLLTGGREETIWPGFSKATGELKVGN